MHLDSMCSRVFFLLVLGALALVFVVFVIQEIRNPGLAPTKSPTLHDATFYYLKASGRSYKVLILHDGSHALIPEPVE